jgi:hypothetical protein
MQHRAILAFISALAFGSITSWTSAQSTPEPNQIYDGLDPNRISPELKTYFETAEAQRTQRISDLITKVAQDQSTISTADARTVLAPDQIQMLKDADDKAAAAIPSAKDAALDRIKKSVDYQQALTDLATAQAVLDDSGSSFDERLKAVNERVAAKDRLHKLEDSVSSANETLQAEQDAREADAAYQQAVNVASYQSQLQADQQELDSLRISRGNFTPSLTESIAGKTTPSAFGTLGDVRVNQVIDENDVLVSAGDADYWLADLPTAGLVDGQTLSVNLVVIDGTKSYTTVMGASRTVRELKLFDPAGEIQAAKAAQAQLQPTPP